MLGVFDRRSIQRAVLLVNRLVVNQDIDSMMPGARK